MSSSEKESSTGVMSPSDEESSLIESSDDYKKLLRTEELSEREIHSSSSEESDDPDYELSDVEALSEYSPGSSSEISTRECLALMVEYFSEGEEVQYVPNPNRREPKK